MHIHVAPAPFCLCSTGTVLSVSHSVRAFQSPRRTLKPDPPEWRLACAWVRSRGHVLEKARPEAGHPTAFAFGHSGIQGRGARARRSRN